MKSLLTLPLLVLAPLAAQDAAPTEPPTDPHEWLHQLVGEWEASSEVRMDEGAPAMTWNSEESARSLGGNWILIEGSSPSDESFASLMTLGYDPDQERFVGTWVDSMQTTLWIYSGSLDESRRVLTLEAEGPAFEDPTRTALYRDVIEVLGDGKKRMTSSYRDEEGEWVTFLTMDATRKE